MATNPNLKKLICGYDVLFPYCEIPNTLNPKYLSFATESEWNFDKSEPYFWKNYQKPWPVFNGRWLVDLNDENGYPGYFAIDKKSTYDIIKDRERGKHYDWYYLIEPYGCVDNFFGLTPEFKDEFFHKFIPQYTIDEIKNHNGFLVINYAIDGGFNSKNLKQLYDSLSILDIPFEKIIIIHNDIHLEKNIEKIFNNKKPKLIHYCWSLNSKSREYYGKIKNPKYSFWNQEDRLKNYTYMSVFDSINFNKKTHKFLNLNRRLRAHRLELIHFFWKENIFSDVLISYDTKMIMFDGLEYIKKKLSVEEFNDFYNYIKHTSPKIVDYDDIENIWGYGFESKEIYEKSLISILSETFFFDENGYLSEKIWKPLAHGHPFIFVGPHGTLKFIKEKFGFKTFSPYIDESYDDEEDAFKRMEMIKTEIKRLNSYSLDELKEIISNLKNVITFNKNLILEYGSKNICLDYLHYLRVSNKEIEADMLLENSINQYKTANNSKKYNLI